MKILQICNKAPFPANDGSSIAIYNMARGLIENKVELHLLTINTKKHFKPDDGVPEQFRKTSNYRSVYRNTNTSISGALLNLFTSRSYFVSRFYFGEFERQLINILRQNRFDIVQLEGLLMGVYIDVIKKHSSAKIVLRAHNVEHFIWQRHISVEKSKLRKFYFALQNDRLKRFELEVMRHVDAIVPITENDQTSFTALGFKGPQCTCIAGVDIKEYQEPATTPQKQKTIFYFGSMDWLPNQEAVAWFLNHCWNDVHRLVPEAKLIIAGRGMPLEFFHINRPNVLIVENVESGKLFFRQNQVMIVPLWSGSGLRIKIIEGMSYGKAIVSTSIGAEGIACTNGENIIIEDTAKGFSEAVVKLLKDETLRKKLETNAASFAAGRFDNAVVVSQLMEFYKKLING